MERDEKGSICLLHRLMPEPLSRDIMASFEEMYEDKNLQEQQCNDANLCLRLVETDSNVGFMMRSYAERISLEPGPAGGTSAARPSSSRWP